MSDHWHADERGSAGLAFGLLSILLASVIGVIIFAITISPSSSGGNGSNGSVAGLPFVGSITTLPGSSDEASGLGGVPPAAEAAACEADAKTVDVALQAYNAENGGFPAPPSPWSAATYTANYGPLTSSTTKGGPYLHAAISTTHYVIEYDSSGNVWVEPPGQYDAAYNPAHSLDVASACADVAR
jgi:hypothetical protein